MFAGFDQLIAGAILSIVTATETDELLPVNSPLLLTWGAEMRGGPAANADVIRTAVYGEPLESVMIPSEVLPSKNCTVPVGPCALGSSDEGVTVAVKVTGWPTFTLVAEVASVTAVVSAVTACVTVFELPALWRE